MDRLDTTVTRQTMPVGIGIDARPHQGVAYQPTDLSLREGSFVIGRGRAFPFLTRGLVGLVSLSRALRLPFGRNNA